MSWAPLLHQEVDAQHRLKHVPDDFGVVEVGAPCKWAQLQLLPDLFVASLSDNGIASKSCRTNFAYCLSYT